MTGQRHPRTAIADEAGVDGCRAEAGLEPLRDYVAEMTAICAEDPVEDG